MNAWPMIQRCLQNQWAGYTPQEREIIRTAWREGTNPGLIGGLGSHKEYILWKEDTLPPHQRSLISVKEDYVGEEEGELIFHQAVVP